MKKLYQRSELAFALVLIGVYMLGNSVSHPLSKRIGVDYIVNAAFCVAMTTVLFRFIKKNGLMKKYGLCRGHVPARKFLWYLPLVVVASQNLWYGAVANFPPLGMVCYIACMLCVGFLEEVLVRGLLFKAMLKDNVRSAIVVSSVAFGVAHLINLINGSGAGLVDNLCQVIGAIAIGFLFVTIFHRGGSLLPCILTHSAINAASAFANEAALTQDIRVWLCVARVVVMAAYTLALLKTLPKNNDAARADMRKEA